MSGSRATKRDHPDSLPDASVTTSDQAESRAFRPGVSTPYPHGIAPMAPLPYASQWWRGCYELGTRITLDSLCTRATYLWGTQSKGWSGVGVANSVATTSPTRVKKR